MIRWLRSLFRPRSAYRAYCDEHADEIRAALRDAVSLQPQYHARRK